MPHIQLAESEDEILKCFPVMQHLHSELIQDDFLSSFRRMQEIGYQLAYLDSDGSPKSVAGFLIGESFAWKKYLYVADMVTLKDYRSQGFGEILMEFIIGFAKESDCKQVHLDSRVIRHEAHKFYINKGFIQGGYHFHMFL